MPNLAGFGELAFEKAVLTVEAALRQDWPSHERRLSNTELSTNYPTRGYARGWRVELVFSDGVTRGIDLLVSRNFPGIYPRTALVDPPREMIWPHVEHDGILCLLPMRAEFDAEDPAQVALHLLGRSVRLIEDLLEGEIVDRDFREEFLTYWFYQRDTKTRITSLLDANGPSRPVRIWRDRDGTCVVGEDQPQLEHWLANRFGKLSSRKTVRTEPAVLLWLPEPPLPRDYPTTGADLRVLASTAEEGAVDILDTVAAALPEAVTVVIGAMGRGGSGLVAATTTSARKSHSRAGLAEHPLTRGFSPRNMPRGIAVLRTYSGAPVIKAEVARADAVWLHGRGKDKRTRTLLGKCVTVVGCGSVGSSLAARLSRAGVGTSHLADPADFDWPNIGRHELGAESIGKNKAAELAARLQRDLPHLTIRGHAIGVQTLIDGSNDLLATSDLIIAATGSWSAESALNRWHIASGRQIPILYGWMESHGAAGHAVTIGHEGGCLRCGFGATGRPHFRACEWPGGLDVFEEPACGNHFTPGGAVELSFVVDLIAEAALAALLDPSLSAQHRLWLASPDQVAASGGRWTEDLLALTSANLNARVINLVWPSKGCPACVEPRLQTVAAE